MDYVLWHNYKGHSKSLKQHLLLFGSYKSIRHAYKRIHNTWSFEEIAGITGNGSIEVHMNYMKDHPLKVLYLFHCFQEAQDPTLCIELIKKFFGGINSINLGGQRLYPYHVVSLGIFLSKSHKDWAELNMYKCYNGDYGINLLHHYVCTKNFYN